MKNSVLKIVEVFFSKLSLQICHMFIHSKSFDMNTVSHGVIPVQRIFLNFDIWSDLELHSLTSCDSDFTRQESDSGEATLPGLLSALLGPTAALARAWRSTQAKS